MRDAIERLLGVEQKAKDTVEKARQEAAVIVSDARRAAQETVQQADAAAREESERVRTDVQARAEQDRDAMLREAAQNAPRIEDVEPARLERAEDRIVHVIAWAGNGHSTDGAPAG